MKELFAGIPNFINFIRRERRLPTYLEIIKFLNIRAEEMPFPTHIQLESTTKCNLDCITCSRKSLSPSRLNKDLSLSKFKYIVNSIPTLKSFQLQGLGEPLLTKDIWKIAKYAKAKKIKLSTTINGILINEKNVDKLLDLFGEIRISLDSVNEENYNKIRVGGNYKRLIKNIQLLVNKRKQLNSKTKIVLTFVVTHLNYHELEDFLKLCIELGCNCGVVEVENWYVPGQKGYKKELEFIKKSRAFSSKIKNLVFKYKKEFKKAGLYLTYSSAEKRKAICRWPFECFITCDGYVTPCCIRQDPDVINFGNVFETPFGEIWNSEKYKMFRRTFIINSPNPICDECPD